jgi:hypothetical protein
MPRVAVARRVNTLSLCRLGHCRYRVCTLDTFLIAIGSFDRTIWNQHSSLVMRSSSARGTSSDNYHTFLGGLHRSTTSTDHSPRTVVCKLVVCLL